MNFEKHDTQDVGVFQVKGATLTSWLKILNSHENSSLEYHGAGLTNMIWMPNKSVILEMHKKKTNNKDIHSLVYWYLADSLNHNYFQQVCPPVDSNSDFFLADLIIDTDELKTNVELIVGNT